MQTFISYSRRDEVFVRRLAQALAASGLDVWMDIEDIAIGSKWSAAIQRGLDTSDVMLVVLSPASMESSNVEDEFTYYLDHQKPIIPILHQPSKVHFQLGRLQYIDFHAQPFDDAFVALQAEIARRSPQGELAASDTPGVIKTGRFPAIPAGDLEKIATTDSNEKDAASANPDLTATKPTGRTGEGTVPATMESNAPRSRRSADPVAAASGTVGSVYDSDDLPTTPPPVEFGLPSAPSPVTPTPAALSVSSPVKRSALIFGAAALAAVAVLLLVIFTRSGSANPLATSDGINDPRVQQANYVTGSDGLVSIKQPDGWTVDIIGNRDLHIYNRTWFGGRFAPEARVPEGEVDLRLISHSKDGRQLSSDDLRDIAHGTINEVLIGLNQRYAIDPSEVSATSVNGNPAYYARGQLDDAEYLMMLIDYQETDWVEMVIVNTGPNTFDDNQAIISDLVESIRLNG